MATDSTPTKCDLIVLAASARALASSCLAAGRRPFTLDLFSDRDTRSRSPGLRLERAGFPDNALEALAALPSRWPLLYGGALENHPDLIDEISRRRPLLGNPGPILREARDPDRLATRARACGFSAPEVRPFVADESAPVDRAVDGRDGRDGLATEDWLTKPLRGANGRGIRVAVPGDRAPDRYLQRRVEGDSFSAVLVASPHGTTLVGCTRQLIGETWLGAAPFQWCGNAGPIALECAPRVEEAASALARDLGLRGIFGLDLVIDHAGTPWLVELNPRWTAAMEVLEPALELPGAELHLRALAGERVVVRARGGVDATLHLRVVLYAQEASAWMSDPDRLPRDVALADLPRHGTIFETGDPVVSVLAHARSIDVGLDQLRAAIEIVKTGSLTPVPPAASAFLPTSRSADSVS